MGCENRSDLDGTAQLKSACLLQRAATYYQKKKCDFINHFPIPKYGIFGGANLVEMRCLFIKCLFGDAHPGELCLTSWWLVLSVTFLTALDCEMVDVFFPGSSAFTKLTRVVDAF